MADGPNDNGNTSSSGQEKPSPASYTVGTGAEGEYVTVFRSLYDQRPVGMRVEDSGLRLLDETRASVELLDLPAPIRTHLEKGTPLRMIEMDGSKPKRTTLLDRF